MHRSILVQVKGWNTSNETLLNCRLDENKNVAILLSNELLGTQNRATLTEQDCVASFLDSCILSDIIQIVASHPQEYFVALDTKRYPSIALKAGMIENSTEICEIL